VAAAVAGVPFMSPEQGRTVYEHVRATRPAEVLELGTAHGVGAAYLAAGLEANGAGTLVTVDFQGARYDPAPETILARAGLAGRAEVVRAVLEGIAHRGADLLDAAEADGQLRVETLRVDGGMSANEVFVQALADACARPVELSPVTEATTLGAAFLAGAAVGTWSFDDLSQLWNPRTVVEPRRVTDRDRWRDAKSRALGQVPELSALDF